MPSRHITISSPRFWSLTRDTCEAGNQEGSDQVMGLSASSGGPQGVGGGGVQVGAALSRLLTSPQSLPLLLL